MSLRAILAAKGDEVVSIDSSADLSAAAELLTKRHIGALVVLDAWERLSRILSERDIVRAMAESGSAVLQMPVAQVMTRNVFSCDVNDSISSVMDRMTKGKISPYAGARQGPPCRHGINRRRAKAAHRDNTRTYPSIGSIYG
ncbi:MAG: CBS domain-containing protein [Pseudolabrys sp.]